MSVCVQFDWKNVLRGRVYIQSKQSETFQTVFTVDFAITCRKQITDFSVVCVRSDQNGSGSSEFVYLSEMLGNLET